MGKVVPFADLKSFVKDLRANGNPIRAILDTNVLISASYEIKDDHEKIVGLLALSLR